MGVWWLYCAYVTYSALYFSYIWGQWTEFFIKLGMLPLVWLVWPLWAVIREFTYGWFILVWLIGIGSLVWAVVLSGKLKNVD